MSMFSEMWNDKDLGGFFKLSVVLGGLLLALIPVGVVGGIRSTSIAADCRARGYSGSDTTWGGFGKGYCVRRVGLVDEVVPL